ncbi:MAG: hypothetical protein K9K66_18915 [Desulfarculaceae bacterium]|nr:hypothetical protein [Desulfarculaceae bacterium]MCF8071931.1 hypothetical protein [Desulfarculaceae bacterium]MCF8103731.1 hypothetical protein [Desulfarculaceae bacterium]MCF8114998.1 hypothetical protein [Desulfarculaceae bacterium]
MKFRLIPAVLLTLLVAVGMASFAWSYPFGTPWLVKEDTNYRSVRIDDFSDPPPQRGMGWDVYLDVDELPLLSAELIRDEHWLELVNFERDPLTVLPVLSAQLYMVYGDLSHSRVRRTRTPTERSRISQATRLPEPGIPVLMRLLFPGQVKGEAVGLLERENRRPRTRGGYSLLNWLFEEEGVFSGTQWDWENFLPRLLSVVALVVAGLFVIEFLRLLVMLGVKAVGSVDKRQP